MKAFLLIASIVLATGKPTGDDMSLKAEVLPNVKPSQPRPTGALSVETRPMPPPTP